jgi:hypothetical protein
VANLLDDRQHAVKLLPSSDRQRSRTRRLTAHVDEIRAFFGHRPGVRDGCLDLDETATVAERIRRDVQHAEDRRSPQGGERETG